MCAFRVFWGEYNPFVATHYSLTAETGVFLLNAGGAGGVTTAYTASPALSVSDDNGAINFRITVQLSAASNGSLQVSFKAGTGGALNIIGASFGKWDGTTLGSVNHNMTTTPFRLTFAGGSNSATVPANTVVASDLIAHTGVTLSAGDWIIIPYCCDGFESYSSNHTTAVTYFRSGGDDSQSQNGSGYFASPSTGNQPGDTDGRNFSVHLVEVSVAGGAPTVNLIYRRGIAEYTGTFAAAGQPATLRYTRKPMPAAAGAFTLTGVDATLTKSTSATHYTMPAATGTFALAGQAAALRTTRSMTAATGTFALAGQAAVLRYGHKTTAGTGTFALSGQTAVLRYGHKTAAGTGTFLLNGFAAGLTYSGSGDKVLIASVGTFALAGQAATLRTARRTTAAAGAFVLAGQAATLTRLVHRTMPAAAGTFTLTGRAATLRYQHVFPLLTGTFVVSGQPVDLRIAARQHYRIDAVTGEFQVNWPWANVGSTHVMQPGVLRFGRRVTVHRW